MVNAIRKASDAKRESIDAEYKLLQKGQYQVNIIPSELGFVMDKKTPLAVYEARNAVRIARAAGADVFATEGFNRAQQLLTQMETKGVSKKERSAAAREVVQRAEDARSASIKRQETENLAFERQNSKDQISMAHSAATTAELGQARAEVAQAKAEVAEGRADVGRATAEDATVTAEAATATAEADAAAAGRRAEAEKAVLRAQLMQQFNSILQTRDSARGLIVNMSGVLFATEKSELQPEAREKLAKISGIVLAHPDLRLEVEGHTDSLGGDASNQTLSERRAQAARDYLVNQGVSANSVVSRGFGSRQPVDSNDTAAGRQNNRRVEIVVTGESIRISMNTQAPR
ncbi:MAG: OmpA family protein [Elusimicrobia bacterium]|nr:OmpA family protein [Elusimicrobiota bacterium]